MIGSSVRAVKRNTVGKAREKRGMKERAESLAKIGEFLSLRGENTQPFNENDVLRVARQNNIPPLPVHVVFEVEAGRGKGFDSQGRIEINIEPHVFSRQSQHRYDLSHPEISYPKWNRYRKHAAPPKGWDKHPYAMTQNEQFEKIAEMLHKDFDAGMCAMSIGRSQVLIEKNWKVFGFPTPFDMFKYANKGEEQQCDLMMMWFRSRGLLDHMRTARFDDPEYWFRLAIYNGTGKQAEYSNAMFKAAKKRQILYRV